MPGLFIQKQAEAISSFCNVAVLYVHSDALAVKPYEIDVSEEQGVKVVRIYYKESNIPFLSWFLKIYKFFKAHRLGLKALRSFQPDLLHVHVLTREGIVALSVKIRNGLPYVITEHWSRYLPASNSFHGVFRKMITRLVVKYSSAMITVSETLKAAMLKFELTNPDFLVVPNPVETNVFTIGNKTGIGSKKRMIHISCFEDRSKNISGFLNAVKSISESRSDFDCVLIGDGPDFELEKKRTEELGLLGKNVFFTGLKEQNELVKEIQAADFMVLSSNYETFGTVVIECLSCGIPVIATNVGIVPEVINKTNGIIIPTGDQDALVAAIDTMLDQVNSYNPDAIRNSVLNKFDNHTIATQLLEIYNSSTHNTLFI
jgi:glycosyltransferase involved in cell wall biosynthesis